MPRKTKETANTQEVAQLTQEVSTNEEMRQIVGKLQEWQGEVNVLLTEYAEIVRVLPKFGSDIGKLSNMFLILLKFNYLSVYSSRLVSNLPDTKRYIKAGEAELEYVAEQMKDTDPLKVILTIDAMKNLLLCDKHTNRSLETRYAMAREQVIEALPYLIEEQPEPQP